MSILFDPVIMDLLGAWYEKHARLLPWRENPSPYRVWLSEIMLQQTRIEAVLPYYERFLTALPTIRTLAEADEDQVLKLWEGLGYYSRARNLQKAARVIAAEYGGVFPQTYEAIRGLPGIGDYTAGAISSICFDLPTPAVDGNVLRVAARLLEIRTPPGEPATRRAVTQALAKIYPPPGSPAKTPAGFGPPTEVPIRSGRCGIFTQSLMELGETLCIPNGVPLCDTCPLIGCCAAKRNGTAAELPVRLPKKEKREEVLTVLLLSRSGRFAVRRRAAKGLLGGMWEFPYAAGKLSEAEAMETARDWGLHPTAAQTGKSHTHVFTHIRWQMSSYVITCEEEIPLNSRAALQNDGALPQNDCASLVWATPEELTAAYALPTAFRTFLTE
ncbi:A/G-specific adenine glycosylase [Clostridia bacterium]|nr:A/G-specific adenine glycosylase [Clostridia bacterium]